MKEIQLTQGKVAIVDDEDYELVSKSKWYYLNNRVGYAQKCEKVDGKWVSLLMHRFIMNAPSIMQIDHINHNGLDNRRSNLRLCTKEENHLNLKLYKNSTTGIKGVHIDKTKYRAQIFKNGRKINIGNFDTIEEATQAYSDKAHELFGEFAYTDGKQ